jgi:hypothetical protein
MQRQRHLIAGTLPAIINFIMTKRGSIIVLIVLFHLFSNNALCQNKWLESLSIVNPININGERVDELNTKKIERLFGKPNSISKMWSEYDDDTLTIYSFNQTYFSFWRTGHIHSFDISDQYLNEEEVDINESHIGDDIITLKENYPKSYLNREEEGLSIHVMHKSGCVYADIIEFKIKNSTIMGFKFYNLN